MSTRSSLMGVGIAVLLVAACSTSPDTAPSEAPVVAVPVTDGASEDLRTPVVAVVLAPQPHVDQIRARLQDLMNSRDEVDWLVATATTADTVAALAGRFVDDGADLVCVVGVGHVPDVTVLALAAGGSRFCVGPTLLPDEPAPNVLHVDLRIQETAYLSGAIAGLVDPQGAAGIITGRASYRTGRQQAAFEKGMQDVGVLPAVTVTGPVGDAEAATLAIEAQFDAGIGVVFATTGPFDIDLVQVAIARADDREQAAADQAAGVGPLLPVGGPTGLIVGEDVVSDEELADVVLAVVRLYPERIVLPALDRLLSVWEPGVASVGLTEGAVSFDLAATPLAAPHVDALNRFRGEIAAGDRDPG